MPRGGRANRPPGSRLCDTHRRSRVLTEDELKAALTQHVREHIGPIAKPKDVVAVADIPKTRSGKITRRLLGELYQGHKLGDISSLQNEEALGANRTGARGHRGE